MKSLPNPKKLMLIDGLGAIFSTIMLGLVLIQLNELIGLAIKELYTLAVLASLYSIYSMSCYFLVKTFRSIHFNIIASANLVHCVITLFLLYQYLDNLKPLGFLYFGIELIALVILIAIEFKLAQNISLNS